MIPWAFFWNNLRLRPLRTLLTILSVAGAVAAVVSVLQATAATQIQLNSIHTTFDSPVAMEVVAADTSPFSADDIPGLAKQPGVATVIPVFRVFTKVIAGPKDVRCLTTGTDLQKYRAIREFALLSGQMATNPGEVSLEASVAEHLGVQPAHDLPASARPKRIVGVLGKHQVVCAEARADVCDLLRLWIVDRQMAPGIRNREQLR